jgi:hypothetical protein
VRLRSARVVSPTGPTGLMNGRPAALVGRCDGR